MKYADCIQHKTAASAGEIGWNLVGTAGGGLLGYLLSRVAHKRRSGLRDLLYALAGAGAGAAGINYAMDRKPDNGGDTWRDRLRNADKIMPEIVRKNDEQERQDSNSHTLSNLAGLGGGIWGGIKGYRGTGIDFSGRASADKMINTAMQAASNKQQLINDASQRFAQVGGKNVPPLKGLREHLRHPLDSHNQRAMNIVGNGNVVADANGWHMDNNIKGQRLANAGRVTADVVGNAALNAALLYGAGRLGGAIRSSIGASTPDIQAMARASLNP